MALLSQKKAALGSFDQNGSQMPLGFCGQPAFCFPWGIFKSWQKSKELGETQKFWPFKKIAKTATISALNKGPSERKMNQSPRLWQSSGPQANRLAAQPF